MRQIALDVECYRNYFLIGLLDLKTGEPRTIDFHGEDTKIDPDEARSLYRVLINPMHEIITFNGLAYDKVMIEAALQGWPCSKLKRLNDALIINKQRPWQMRKRAKIKEISFNHIDLFWVTPMIASLKTYGARIHTRHLQDLPYAPDLAVKKKHLKVLRKYVINDCTITGELRKTLSRELELRVALGKKVEVDLRSKSDAQIAETILSKELGIRKQSNPGSQSWELWYQEAKNISFKSKRLNQLLDDVLLTPFYVNASGYLSLAPEFTETIINVAGRNYKFGTGGLHSMEQNQSYYATDKFYMEHIDVSSFYPRIIINERLVPNRLTHTDFIKVYKRIFKQRIAAKKAGDTTTADSLKVTIVASFGKFGSKYSALYDPQLLLQVTVTGQLYLLMLIEMLSRVGAEVISANTDGVIIRYPRQAKKRINKTKAKWERLTNCALDKVEVKSLHSRDVNTYIMIGDKVKRMGAWGEQRSAWQRLRKNPNAEVSVIAAVKYIRSGQPLMRTIKRHKDIRDFIVCQNVRGGAHRSDEANTYLGTTIRWYYSTASTGPLYRCDNGNKVPRSDGSMPVMTLPEKVPTDTDFRHYFDEARKILDQVGIEYIKGDVQRRLI